MQVDHRGGDIRMPETALHRPDVRPGLHESASAPHVGERRRKMTGAKGQQEQRGGLPPGLPRGHGPEDRAPVEEFK